jgi:hypothetical protein
MISKILCLSGLSLLLASATYVIPGDGPKVYLATYKNDAEGAYTLIHDDFGGDWAQGIEQYADTMAYKRGIPFCFALITGQCDGNDWKNANQMISHGHQVVNHSMYHKCGKNFEWCKAGIWDEHDFNIEIDSSTNLIKTKTKQHPAFFMFPFDMYTDTMISYLRDKGYAGARAGNNNALQSPDIADPLHLNYRPFSPENSLNDLNSFVFQAMEKKSWAIREVHGVNDGSWGKISLEDYEGHMNYLQRLSRSDSIWVATLSDVMMYQMLRKKYSLTSTMAEGTGKISKINFIARDFQKPDSLIYTTAMATSKLRSLTIVLVQGKSKLTQVTQKGKKIPFRKSGEKILIEADPAAGPLSLTYK